MASKADAAAAKQRQQKMILIVGGVLLAGLLAFQGPKLMKQLKGSKTAAPAAATDGTAAPGTTPGATGTTGTVTPGTGTVTPAVGTVGGGPSGEVAGVVIRPVGAPAASTGQLTSFTRFKAKDPFVQQVNETPGGGGGDTGTTTGSTTTPGGTTGTATPTTSTPAALGYATLMVNGKAQQLQLKDVFPKGNPTFVLTAIDKDFVKVTVAGGKFAGGGAIKLERGKSVTLMNTTTGQRFVMKLVYTGAQPEEIAGFKQPAATSGQTTTTTSGQTTTTTTPTTTTKAPSTVSATTSAYTP